MKKLFFILFYLYLIFVNDGLFCQVQRITGQGQASFYADWLQGHYTANGEKLNNNNFTAANKYLPFNTIIKVTNVLNNNSVYVRINDRGPFRHSRILDLSRAAANKLDMFQYGLADVRFESIPVLSDTPLTLKDFFPDSTFYKRKNHVTDSLHLNPKDTFYYIKTAISLDDCNRLDHLIAYLNELEKDKIFIICQKKDNYCFIYTGVYKSLTEASTDLERLKTGYGFMPVLKIYLR